MRNLGQLALGFILTIVVAALWRALPFEIVAPQVSIVMGTYLGVTARDRLASSTATGIAIGYLGDLLGGLPVGATALATGLAVMLARLTTMGLLVRGRGFMMGLTFALHLVAVAVAVIARASIVGTGPGPFGALLLVSLGGAAASGALAVPIGRLCRSLDARFARTQRDRDAVREGYLN